VGMKGQGDGYGIGSEDCLSILELAKLFGGDVVMLPERQGNRLEAGIDAAKMRALGWAPKQSLRNDIALFLKTAQPAPAPEKRVLVFTTTFHPVSGPAEDALVELMTRMPEVQFDIITAAHSKEAFHVPSSVPNATIHRIGFGNRFDKFLLPFLGRTKAFELADRHRYLFSWSIMASYGALPALAVRRKKFVPLLITLADQSLSWYERIFLRVVLSQTDQVYTSIPEQGKKLLSLEGRMRVRKSLGEGDAFANAIRFAYSSFLRQSSKKGI